MRITCPTCSTQYDVDENDIAFTGQDVQCTECMTVWTQARSGEATNPRLAGELSEDGEEISVDQEETPAKETSDVEDFSSYFDELDEDSSESAVLEDTETEPETETSAEEIDLEAPLGYASLFFKDMAEEQAREQAAEDARKQAEEQNDIIPETENLEVPEVEAAPLEEASTSFIDEAPAEDGAPEDDSVEPDQQGDVDDENPVWKEIAALAQEARADSDSESTPESNYTPPDDMPPIQSSPVIPDDPEPAIDELEDDDRPWESAAEAEEGFSDFVWSDPSDEEVEEVEEVEDEVEIVELEQPVFTPLAEVQGEQLDDMDDDLIAAALNEQMAIEDALEDEPKPEERDISSVPVELGGPRARVPNVEALKSSVRSKSVKLTAEELQTQVPARRFRRGVSLTLLIFVILGATYISRDQITEYVPAIGPYLETYATFVDLLRARAEVLGSYVWTLLTQGYDWVIAKFFS